MEWSSILQTFLSGALGSGLFVSLLFFKENKRAKQLENEAAAVAQWKQLYEKEGEKVLREEAKNADLNAKIDALYKEISNLRDKNDKMSSLIAVLRIFRCRNIKCVDRVPPIDENMDFDNNQ